MKRKSRFIGLICTILLICFCTNLVAFAQTNVKTGFSSKYESTTCYVKTSGIYKYYCYVSKTKGTIINVTDGEHITDVMSHKYGKSGKTLSASKTTSFSYSKTSSWNAQLGISVGDDLVKGTANAGYGVSTGWTCGSSYTKTATLSESEIKTAPTGLYSLCAGRPHYKIECIKKNWVTRNTKSTTYYYMPTGSKTVYIMYSDDNQNTWSIYS